MLRCMIEQQRPRYITTYTRNPAILRMIQSQSSSIYPLDLHDPELPTLALQMPHAEQRDVTYHLRRYDNEGLFGGSDPAEQSINDVPLRERFIELKSVRSALVVAARVGGYRP